MRTLDETERVRQLIQAARILNEEVGTIPLYYAPSVFVFPSALSGPDPNSTKDTLDWNLHTWELR